MLLCYTQAESEFLAPSCDRNSGRLWGSHFNVFIFFEDYLPHIARDEEPHFRFCWVHEGLLNGMSIDDLITEM